jgi:EAL domain-containing protein (putative c-di-GMP-specific phosphodiesterase class I)
MDDFGVGHSSFSLLKRLPFDTLKIDRSFVARVDTEGDDNLLIQAIVAMAHSLHKRVIAEGVETRRQAELLQAIHCDYAQGWLYGEPQTATKIAASLVHSGGAAPTPLPRAAGQAE